MDDLTAARKAREDAIAREREALANLRAAGINAKRALDEMDGSLTSIARRSGLSPSGLAKLMPSQRDGAWKPLRVDTYETIDTITGSRYGLVALRRLFDEAKLQVRQAQTDVALAEAKVDSEQATRRAGSAGERYDVGLIVDDVLVDRQPDRVVLDVRVRNAGDQAVNITRAAVRIIERSRFLTTYPVSAQYDLWVSGNYSECGVAHHVRPGDVDRFTLALGFAEPEIGNAFSAELLLHFNRDSVAVSKPFSFDSCFE